MVWERGRVVWEKGREGRDRREEQGRAELK